MIVNDLLVSSLRLIGAIASGETLSSSEASDALQVLNLMLDSWSTNGLLIYQVVRESFPFVPSQQTYTVGTGGNFNTTRPVKYIGAGIEIPGVTTTELPIDIVTVEEWQNITVKQTQSSLPQKMYSQGNFPLDSVSFWPIPSVANNLILYSEKPLTAFATVNDTVQLPPGYGLMIRYNLAVFLADEYGKAVSQKVMDIADTSLADVKRQNSTPQYMAPDQTGASGSQKPFNWLTGE